MPLRGGKILRHAHKPGPWYLDLCISFRTTAHREWLTLVTARLPVARLTILDRLVLMIYCIICTFFMFYFAISFKEETIREFVIVSL